ncbi:MAG TPA: TonB-dependent receptor [Bryobacteraceae bacterium]|nr:TonB-dependent receptor [Bryobacteraceae bacterium]
MRKLPYLPTILLLACLWSLRAQAPTGSVGGVVSDQSKTGIGGALITATNLDTGLVKAASSAADGTYQIGEVPPGTYTVRAEKPGYSQLLVSSLQITPGRAATADFVITLEHTNALRNVAERSFWRRLASAYLDDWHDRQPPGLPDPKYRGYEAPESNPPFPFTVWPYGGSPVIGQPNTMVPPLMAAIYAGPGGEAWQASKVQVYGWADVGFNVSSSNKPGTANLPAAYYVYPNTVSLDQAALYIERVPDTVQTDHFDWGFRVTGIYGIDYRFTTSKGVFSNQLLENNQANGFDPVMVYADLYFPQVAEGMNVRIGRYVSLPDIEAQLAPNNYTYSHSLTYIYDCYTQHGINVTTKLSDHWMLQTGFSAGCDAAWWTKDAKPTGTVCLNYTWRAGKDDIYACANSINDGKYAYNNLAAYYLTWYHKINSKWHFDTESWYQYERDVPSIFGSVPAELGANGAWCAPGEQTCFAPEWAITNYVERQFGKKDTLSIRNEYFDDIRGQRTGYKDKYTEHLVSWNHWIGTSLVFRPELRFEHAYNNPAYDNGTKKSQFIVAGDMIWFF